jgi:DNA-binding NtrC family response regulator
MQRGGDRVTSFLGKRLLLVEDDVDTLDALRAWAEDLECFVQAVPSGHQALEAGRIFKPHVLITDYLLQGDLTGVDVIVSLRKVLPELTCVLITGMLHEALRESLHRIEGVLILAKPLNLDRLQRIVLTARATLH